jgi:hypothetical protein
MSIFLHLCLNMVNQLGKIFPFHIFAFAMEVKPDVLQLIILELFIQFSEFFSDAVLATFLIN